jgi:hydroxyacylglutathione hydrolase
MVQYLASVRRLFGLDPPVATIAPGHGALIVDPAAALHGIIDHRLVRETAVARALERAERATVDELLPIVYADVAEALLPVARFSLWAHLRKLGAEGRARSDDADDIHAAWASTG